MSFYDDSTLMFLAAGAVGKDGKASTIKPVGGAAPLLVTRGSNLTATRVDKNGLIEKGRENLLKQSNNFGDTSVWIQLQATRSSGQEGYDGTSDAWEISRSSGGGLALYQMITNNSGVNTALSGVNTFSIYVKVNSSNGIGLAFGSTSVMAQFNISDTLQTDAVVENGIIASTQEYVGNNFYRISVTADTTASNVRLYTLAASGTSVISSGATYIVQDAQTEIGLVATEYIESGASSGKAGLLENEPRFNYPIGGGSPHLLLEPQRSNLIAYSEYFEGGNWGLAGNATLQLRTSITAPDGSNAVYLLSGDGETITGRMQYNSGSSSDDQVYSIFIKGVLGIATRVRLQNSTSSSFLLVDIDSSGNVSFNSQTAHDNYYGIEDYGNGWYRLYLKTTTDGSGQLFRVYPDLLDGDGSVYVWGAQIEVQQYVTSYIPNHSGGSVSRESDIYQNTDIDTVTNMSTDECTVFLDVDLPQGREGSSRFLQFVDIAGGGSTYFGLKGNYVPSPIIQLIGGGTINTSSTHSLNVGRHKIAIRWLSGTATVFIDGAEVSALSVTDSSAPTSFDKVYGSGAPYRHLVHQLIVLTSGWDDLDCRVLTGLTDYYASFSEMATALNYTIYE